MYFYSFNNLQLWSYRNSFIVSILYIFSLKQNLIIKSNVVFMGSEYEAFSNRVSISFSDSSNAIPNNMIVSLDG